MDNWKMEYLDTTEIYDLIKTANLLDEMEQKNHFLSGSKERRTTIPVIFDKAGNENFLSDYLAYILDPKKNGVGIAPLEDLLYLGYEIPLETDQVLIKREYIFKNSHGRIDFVIELGENGEKGIIGIENKIFSTENENQTIAYENGLKRDFQGKNIYMIFLTPNGQLPSAKEFKPVSYKDLLKALRKTQYPVLKDIHKTIIWEDFIYHLEEYIVMNDGKLELSGKTKLFLEHQEMMDGLLNAFQNDSKIIYEYVTNRIENKFGEGWNFIFLGRNSYQEINRLTWRIKDFYVYYQFVFSREELLTGDSYSYMLGLYPKTNECNLFYEWLKKNQPEIINICLQNDLESYPETVRGTGGNVIANKEYPLVLEKDDLSNFHNQFLQSIDDFLQLNPIIDIALKTYAENNHL